MLKQNISTTGGHLPPVDQSSSEGLGYIPAEFAANEPRYKGVDSHARRMRRQRRNDRTRSRRAQGWAVRLW